MYYYAKNTAFGKTPPAEDALIRSFLKGDRFLLTFPNLYNSLGVGRTQLYNLRTVYNHKRHGVLIFGNQKFYLKIKIIFQISSHPNFFWLIWSITLIVLQRICTKFLKTY